ELSAFGVQAKLVEPGYAPTTRFAVNTDIPVTDLIPEAYADYAGPIFAAFADPPLTTRESDVAEVAWLAATDGSDRLHYPAGADAVALARAA
ncbi:MAG: short-chain dehydrogenase/reductase, partial [Pseudorhodobacter sp.]|nr:short-chain dehydrogenase/reductase [Pseudorhodobacter sp.]